MGRIIESRPIWFCVGDAGAVVGIAALTHLGAAAAVLCALAWWAAAVAFGLCDHRWWGDPRALFVAAAKTWLATTMVCLAAAMVLPPVRGAWHLIALPPCALGFGLGVRVAWRALTVRRRRRVVVVDAAGEQRLAAWLARYWPEWEVVSILRGHDLSAAEREAAAQRAQVVYYLNGRPADAARARLKPLALDDLLEQVRGRVPLDHADAVAPPASRLGATVKRGMDICLAGGGLVVLSPLLALLAALIKLDSPGPALYRQRRLGLGRRPFQMLKFRSMVKGAEEETGPIWASPDDPRCTRIGRLLRPLHLDELPQLVNVLRGEMSLVGPRPERPELAQTLLETLPAYSKRLLVKPGISGWAQVNQGYDREIDDVRRKVEYDLFYVKRAGPLFDAAILLRTIDAVIFGKQRRAAQRETQ